MIDLIFTIIFLSAALVGFIGTKRVRKRKSEREREEVMKASDDELLYQKEKEREDKELSDLSDSLDEQDGYGTEAGNEN